jgi:hypothetical protein
MQEQRNWFSENAGATEELVEDRPLPSQDKHAALRLAVFIFKVRESLLVLSHIKSSDKRLALELKRVLFRKIYGQEPIHFYSSEIWKRLRGLRSLVPSFSLRLLRLLSPPLHCLGLLLSPPLLRLLLPQLHGFRDLR